MSEVGKEIGWDEEVAKGEGGEFLLLPEGDYDFTIETFERGRYDGSDKVPPCNKAMLKLRIATANGSTLINESLMLYDKMQWKIAEFFISIGEREVDGKVKMNWPAVPGSTGRATIIVTPDRNDPEKKYNHVKKWLPKELKKFEAGRF